MLKVKIELVHPNAKMPIKGTSHAACWDVFAAEIKKLGSDLWEVNLGFKLQPPWGYKVVLVPRSSITKTYLVQQNSPGQGDEDYRGEYKYIFRLLPMDVCTRLVRDPVFGANRAESSLEYPPFPYVVGDRVGQIYIEKVLPFEFEESILSETERGSGGFGSTGGYSNFDATGSLDSTEKSV